jgi:cytochrome c-type biogenesis protein CcmH
MPGDLQSRANQRIFQQHLVELDQALAEGRLNAAQHTAARDELLRQVLDDASMMAPDRRTDAATAPGASPNTAHSPAFWGGLMVLLLLLTGMSYALLGAPHSWRALPLSQRVQVHASSPEEWAAQTRLWQQTTAARPDDAEAWLTLARLHAAQKAYALAEAALARVLALSPEPDLWLERAQMKALNAGGVYAGEPWQWIENVLRQQPQHLNALVLAGSAALSEKRLPEAQAYWQQALRLVPAESEAAHDLQQALAQAAEGGRPSVAAAPQPDRSGEKEPGKEGAVDERPAIQGEVRVAPEVQSRIGANATLFVYALDEAGSRRPIAIWRGSAKGWPVQFALSDRMGMGAGPVLSSLPQVRLVARISQTGSAQKQTDDWQVELPGVKTGVQGVVLHITGR